VDAIKNQNKAQGKVRDKSTRNDRFIRVIRYTTNNCPLELGDMDNAGLARACEHCPKLNACEKLN